jgi:TPR repeat protein
VIYFDWECRISRSFPRFLSSLKISGIFTAGNPIDELWRMADEDDTRSQIHFGEMLQKCEGIERNLSGAVRYFQLAADQGDSEGIVEFGLCLMKGEGVSRDQEAAVVQFKSAVNLGLAEGQYWLAHCIKYDWACFKDFVDTSHLFKIAADAEHKLAANEFGSACERSLSMAKNIPQVVHYFPEII